MSVPFQHLNGSQIDLFLKPQSDEWVLSDFGQTIAYLMDLQVNPWSTAKRKQLVEDICKSLKIEQHDGEFKTVIRAANLNDDLSSAMVRLSQACIRISDLAFTQRLRSPVLFKEDVAEFLETSQLKYEEDYSLVGQFGNRVEVDFSVTGRSVHSLVQTLSTGNAAAAHSLGNEVFRRWYDLTNQKPKNQFLTIYDTNTDFFKKEDLKRIESVSTILGYPAQAPEIQQALSA